MSVPGRERAGGEERRHAGEAGMRGRDGGNKIREQEGGEEVEGGCDHLCHGGPPPDTQALLCILIFELCAF